MRRTLLWIVAGLAPVLVVALLAVGRAERVMLAGLAGARPVIEAQFYPTLQAALDAVPEEGGVVRLPPGIFELHEPLIVRRSDVLLVGSGPSTHLKNMNEKGEAALLVQHPEHPAPKTSVWRVQLADFRLTGNERSGDGIRATHVNEIFIEGVTVSKHGGHGIVLDNCYEDPRINDSLITYNKKSGVELLGCHDIVVCGNHFEENLDALRCLDGYNLCFTGNNVDDHLRHGVVIENTYGSVLSGNMIEECQDTGIVLDRDCYGITVSANVIAHEMKCGIDLRDAHGCAITGNSFPLVHDRAVVVAAASGRIPIVGNAFGDSYIGEGRTRRPPQNDPTGGIVVDGGKDVLAVANVFSGLATGGVTQPTPGTNVVLEHNLEVSNGSDPDATSAK